MADILETVREDAHERVGCETNVVRAGHEPRTHQLHFGGIERRSEQAIREHDERRIERGANALEAEETPVLLRADLELGAEASNEAARGIAGKSLRPALRRVEKEGFDSLGRRRELLCSTE